MLCDIDYAIAVHRIIRIVLRYYPSRDRTRALGRSLREGRVVLHILGADESFCGLNVELCVNNGQACNLMQ